MGIDNLIAIVLSGVAVIWTIFRDKSGDDEVIKSRLTILESKVENHSTEISRLDKKQEEMDDSISKLQDQIHKLDLKIERILTILEGKN